MENTPEALLANVSSSATSVTLFPSSPSATARLVYNDSSAIVYIKFDSTAASTTSYTTQIAAGAFYTFPQPCYSGVVTAIWASANGSARTTELAGG